MSIYIDNGGETAGPFTLEEINIKLARGELTTSTLAWIEGWPEWGPLNRIRGITVETASAAADPQATGDTNKHGAAKEAGSAVEAPSSANTSPAPSTVPSESREDTTASDSDLQQQFYRQVIEAFQTAANHLMQPFDQLDDLLHKKKPMHSATFFRFFLRYAAEFNGNCTVAFATVLRHSTQLESVRATTVKQLAKEIRGEAFEDCDAALEEYHQTVNILTGGADALMEQVDREGVPMGSTGGALLGSLVAGKGSRLAGAAAGGVAAYVDAMRTLNRQAAVLGQAQAMIEEAEKLAPRQVGAYLDAIAAMPDSLVDLLGAKCFGAAVNMQAQQRCAEACTEHIKRLGAKAVESIGGMYRYVEETSEAEKAREESQARAEQQERDDKLRTRRRVRLIASFIFTVIFSIYSWQTDGDGSPFYGLVFFIVPMTGILYIVFALSGW